MKVISADGWSSMDGLGTVFDILAPAEQILPLVFASPHSGSNYPTDFVAGSALDPATLRKSEDSFVDELFAAAPSMGAPLIRALFPRAWLDVNREPYELDPAMFADRLPKHANTRSPRVAMGLGTVARLVASGMEIYADKLRYAEVEHRIERFYYPYHRALHRLIERTWQRFGYCLLIDCHSMPSSEGGSTKENADFVLGDIFGTSAAVKLSLTVERLLSDRGYSVVRNIPYAGGFTTYHYGHPARGIHALQIEINRRLYMDEKRYQKNGGFGRLSETLTALMSGLAVLPAKDFLPEPDARSE